MAIVLNSSRIRIAMGENPTNSDCFLHNTRNEVGKVNTAVAKIQKRVHHEESKIITHLFGGGVRHVCPLVRIHRDIHIITRFFKEI